MQATQTQQSALCSRSQGVIFHVSSNGFEFAFGFLGLIFQIGSEQLEFQLSFPPA